MTNLGNILKSRDIPLPVKVCIFKAMVFPIVKHGCESWTIKKAEHPRITLSNFDAGEDSWEALGQPGNQINSLEGLMLKLEVQYFGHLMWRTDSLEKTLMLEKTEHRRGWEWQRMNWLDGITVSMDMNLSKL